MSALVLREDKDGVATLTLNRADKRNALNLALWGFVSSTSPGIARIFWRAHRFSDSDRERLAA